MAHQAANKTKVLEALTALGEQWASDWLWTCTPYPAELPSEEQCNEAIAASVSDNPDVKIGAILQRCHDEMWEAYNNATKNS
jgi:hypothetical protein